MRYFNVFKSCELSTLHILGYNPSCSYFIACLAAGFAVCMVEATTLDKSVDKSENGLHLSKNSAQLLGASSTAKTQTFGALPFNKPKLRKFKHPVVCLKISHARGKMSESRVTHDEQVKMRGLSNCSGHSLFVPTSICSPKHSSLPKKRAQNTKETATYQRPNSQATSFQRCLKQWPCIASDSSRAVHFDRPT